MHIGAFEVKFPTHPSPFILSSCSRMVVSKKRKSERGNVESYNAGNDGFPLD